MDRALKERIVGAVVLVVLAVLIVPVFLDGPSSDVANVQESIRLPGQEAQNLTQKTIVLARDRQQPMPDARPPGPDRKSKSEPHPPAKAIKLAAVTPTAASKKQPTPKAEKKRPAADNSSTGMWAVQLGSFSNKENAERLAASLRKEGFAAFLSQLQSAEKELHRVRIGPQKDRADAESVAAKLSQSGHKGQVVPHP